MCNHNVCIFTANIGLVGKSNVINVSEEPGMGLQVHTVIFLGAIKSQCKLCHVIIITIPAVTT